MRIEHATSCPVSIFMAGNSLEAENVCRDFCDEVGLCVTVTHTVYAYTGGRESGFIVGLINYPRFPSEQPLIEDKAIQLGMKLREALGQESFSVQTPMTTTWFRWRVEDNAIAAAAREGGDAKQAPGNAPQSGAASASPDPRRIA